MLGIATMKTASLSDLERLIKKRRQELDALLNERSQLEKKLKALDERIDALNGSGGSGRVRRAKNKITLVAAMEKALTSARKPLRVGEIMNKVKSYGYDSTSANFRGLVNQTLIKGKQFKSTARGVYELKDSPRD